MKYTIYGKVTTNIVAFSFTSKIKFDRFNKLVLNTPLLTAILIYEDIQELNTTYYINSRKSSFNRVIKLVVKEGNPSWQKINVLSE